MSGYRLRWSEGPALVQHVWEARGTLHVQEDDGPDTHRTLMRALCRRPDLWAWCDDGNLDMTFPLIEGGTVPDGVCPACKAAADDRARPAGPDTPSLLDMLEVVGA